MIPFFATFAQLVSVGFIVRSANLPAGGCCTRTRSRTRRGEYSPIVNHSNSYSSIANHSNSDSEPGTDTTLLDQRFDGNDSNYDDDYGPLLGTTGNRGHTRRRNDQSMSQIRHRDHVNAAGSHDGKYFQHVVYMY